jgi:hypothetical protein
MSTETWHGEQNNTAVWPGGFEVIFSDRFNPQFASLSL